MNEIQFSEEQLGDLQTIGQALFASDAGDPRSWNYRRQLVRPVIPWGKILGFILLFALGALGAYFALAALGVPAGISLLICAVGTAAALLIHMKRILICLVRIYQRFAPDSLRNKCRFEPSCSQYMILSLQKYGLWKGLGKGIHRLRRCGVGDGGFDEP